MSIADVQIRSFIRQMLYSLREEVGSDDMPYERTPDEGVVTLRYRTSAREKATGQDVHGLTLIAISEQKDLLDVLERAWP